MIRVSYQQPLPVGRQETRHHPEECCCQRCVRTRLRAACVAQTVIQLNAPAVLIRAHARWGNCDNEGNFKR